MYFVKKRWMSFKWVKAEAENLPLVEPCLIIFYLKQPQNQMFVFFLFSNNGNVLICPELNRKQKQLCRTTVATGYANTAALMFFSQRHEKQDLYSSS